MLALVAVLLANADGRSGIALSRLLSARSDRRVTVGIAFGAFIVNAVVAATAGAIANRMIGQGVAALLVTLAMLSAAGALLWPMKPVRDAGADDARGSGRRRADWSAGRCRGCPSSPLAPRSPSGPPRGACAGRPRRSWRYGGFAPRSARSG